MTDILASRWTQDKYGGTLNQWVAAFTRAGHPPVTADIDPLGGGVVWWHLYWAPSDHPDGPFVIEFSTPYEWGTPNRGQADVRLVFDNRCLPLEHFTAAKADLDGAAALIPKLRAVVSANA